MSFTEDGDRTDLNGEFAAVCYSNEDPKHLGRIRATVPGVQDNPAGGWLLPQLPGAGPQRGLWAIPRQGDEVVVVYYHGNPDRGYYRAANWSEGNIPTETRGDNGKPDPGRMVLASDRYVIVMGQDEMVIKHRGSGNHFKLSSRDLSIVIEATAGITLKTSGALNLDATLVQVNGVPLVRGGNQF